MSRELLNKINKLPRYDLDQDGEEIESDKGEYIRVEELLAILDRPNLTVTIDLVPYEVRAIPEGYRIENLWGVQGLTALRRHNRYGEPGGATGNRTAVYIGDGHGDTSFVDVSTRDERALLEVIRYISNAYPTIGWECLT